MATRIEVLYLPEDKSFVELLFRGVTLSFQLKKEQPICVGRMTEGSSIDPRATWVPPKIFAEACRRAVAILKS